MMDWDGHMTTGGWVMSAIWTLIVLALVVAGLVWLYRSVGSASASPPVDRSPREILDRRLASGELSVDEYERLKDTLDSKSQEDRDPANRQMVDVSG